MSTTAGSGGGPRVMMALAFTVGLVIGFFICIFVHPEGDNHAPTTQEAPPQR